MLQLLKHQQRFVEVCRVFSRYLWAADCGVGKTIGMLAVCRERTIRTVVACPKAIIDDAWLRDAAHFPMLKVVSGRAPKPADRRRIIADKTWDVLVMNYEPLIKHADDLVAAGARRLVFDESSALKCYNSQRTKACLLLAAQMEECYCLSGTPAPNGEHEYWAQLRCINPAKVPLNYWRFCNQWMIPHKRTINGREVTTGWTLMPSRRKDFEKLLAECSWALTKEECVDLPERTNEYRAVELSIEELQAYITMKHTLTAATAQGSIDATTQARFMKLRQLTGGWAYGPERSVLTTGQSKLDELVAVLEEIGRKPVVIWAEFTHDIDRISGALGGEARTIDGRTDDDDRRNYIDGFGERFRYLICHPKAVGHGVTLVQASYAVYYSVGYSYELYHQSRDRIHRVGQKHPCTYIHLIAADTCDRQVLDVLQAKGSAHEAMMAALSIGGAMDGREAKDPRTACA